MDTKAIIQSQFLAALEMLKNAIEQCPEGIWADPEPQNKFWHTAYHSLFYAHFYLHPSESDFIPWEKHRTEVTSLKPSDDFNAVKPYTKIEVLEYLDFCREQVKEKIAACDLEAESGFPWLPFSTLEKHIYNLRHVQQHTGELFERLGQAGIEVHWVGKIDH